MPNDLTPLHVNLIPAAAEALDDLATLTRMSETDVVNRALQVFRLIESHKAAGGDLLARYANGEVMQIVYV